MRGLSKPVAAPVSVAQPASEDLQWQMLQLLMQHNQLLEKQYIAGGHKKIFNSAKKDVKTLLEEVRSLR